MDVSPRQPFTCAHPVIPAFSQCRLLYRVISFRNFCTECGRSGRRPTTLMSPLRTLITCGISSRLVFHKTAPTLVLPQSFSVVQWVSLSEHSQTFMVRNFSIWKRV